MKRGLLVALGEGLSMKEKAAGILGGHLVTEKRPGRQQVNKILLRRTCLPGESEPSEYYMSVLLDRASGNNTSCSPEGGMDIEAA